MTDEHNDGGRGELIAAHHQVTTFAEGLLNLTEKFAVRTCGGADQSGPRRADLRRQLEMLDRAARPLTLDVEAVERQVRQRLADCRGMLGRQVGWTRQIFTKLLDGKMTLTPVTPEDGSKGYELGGTFRYDNLLHGLLPEVVRPRLDSIIS